VAVGGANYYVEVDAFGAKAPGKWSAETNQTWLISGALTGTSYEHLFVGAQRGRWRVRAKIGNCLGPWTDWRYFTYKV
jgi:hypothetical protein